MWGNIASILNIVSKVTPVPLLAIAGTCAFLLYAPDSIITALSAKSIRDAHRGIIGVVLVASAIYLVVQFGWWIRGEAPSAIRRHGRRRQQVAALRRLSHAEKDFLRPWIRDRATRRYVAPNDCIANALVASGILCWDGAAVDPARGRLLCMPRQTRKYLEAHAEILGANLTDCDAPEG